MSQDSRSQERWQDVRDKVEGLGLKLKLHLEQEQDEADTSAAPGETTAAIEEMGAKLQDAFNSLGNAAKDPAIRADMKDLGALLKDAMTETFAAVGAEVEGIIKKTKAEKAAEDAAGEDSTAADAAAEDEVAEDATADDPEPGDGAGD